MGDSSKGAKRRKKKGGSNELSLLKGRKNNLYFFPLNIVLQSTLGIKHKRLYYDKKMCIFEIVLLCTVQKWEKSLPNTES